MNDRTTTANTQNRERLDPDRVVNTRKNQPDPALLQLLRGAMVVLGGAILLVGMLLIILPMFRVKSFRIEGESFYTEAQIIEASGIEIGEEILSIDRNEIYQRIWDALPYVNGVKLTRSFSTVKITVKENTNLMYTEFGGSYYTLNRDFRVLSRTENEEDLNGFLRVELPEVAALGVGSKIRFENEALDTGYIVELLETLERGNVLSRVTSVDVSKKYDVSYVMENSCRVELGKVGDMSLKLTLVEEILSRKGADSATNAVVDVSDLQKPTYRALGQSEQI